MRTMQLASLVVQEGCDPIEAGSNAVAVEEQANEFRVTLNPRWRNFQDFFEDQISKDPDMALKGLGICASFGSLSHGHFNCVNRNILSGKDASVITPAVAGNANA